MRTITKYSISFRIALLLVGCLTLIGCGRYGDPLPPEAFAPASVNDIEVVAPTAFLHFFVCWKSAFCRQDGKN